MEYTALVSDSRKAVKGCLFFCKGKQFKKEYLDKAIEKGAAAYVSETDYKASIPCILVPDIRKAMAEYSKDFFKDPSSSLKLIGLTGTKGKSTTLYFLKSIMENSSLCGEGKFGYLSSVDDYDGIEKVESHLTTPEAIELNTYLSNMVKSGIIYAGMEVSSQALKYDRSLGLHFKAGCFTNFSEDHIGPDEHSDIEDYFASKLRLIDQCDTFILNLRSDRSKQVLDACLKSREKGILKKIVCLYTSFQGEEEDEGLLKRASSISDCIYKVTDIDKKEGETFFHMTDLGTLSITMPGLFNIENAAIASIFALEYGVKKEEIAKGLREEKTPGRMEIFRDTKKAVTVIVDFAHNEFALDNIFASAKKEYPNEKIIAVFGCPGNKAPERRVGMPRSAAKYADYVYITEDDPFREDPKDICKEVYDNLISFGGSGEIVVNREEAVRKAITKAKKNSVVLVLGKGQDTFMHRLDFDPYISDPQLVKNILEE